MQSENPLPARNSSQDFWSIVGEQRLWLLAIILLALLLRFYQIGQQSFWTDEVRSIWVFTRPKQCLHFDMHGPLHAVLVVFWSIWGGLGTAWTRALSALIGAGTVPLFYVLVRRLGGARVALIASFLLAISPFHVWYSQEMRNYALFIGTIILCQLFFIVSHVVPRQNPKELGSRIRARHQDSV